MKLVRTFLILTLLGILTLGTSSWAAVAPGFYMGLRLGPATNSGGTQQVQVQGYPPDVPSPVKTPATPKSKQFGSAFFLGYKINEIAGFEFGGTYYTGIKYDAKNVPTCSSTQVRLRDFQAEVRGELPLGPYFDIFGKAGVAAVYVSTSGALNYDPSKPCGKSAYTTNFRPTVTLGVSSTLAQTWVIELSANRLLSGGPAGNVDFYAIGFSYHFVDIYCGQFLC